MSTTSMAVADPRAREFLRTADPVLARLIDARPDFHPRAWMEDLPSLDAFGTLVFQVIGQQLSVRATRTILSRLEERFRGRVPSPAELLAADPQVLRASGMSARKAATLRALAERFVDGRLSDEALSRMTDAEIPAASIGPWLTLLTWNFVSSTRRTVRASRFGWAIAISMLTDARPDRGQAAQAVDRARRALGGRQRRSAAPFGRGAPSTLAAPASRLSARRNRANCVMPAHAGHDDTPGAKRERRKTTMADFKHEERVSRQQAAERLTDVAYALVAGSPVVLRIDGEQVRVPDADELVLRWGTRSTDGALRLELEVRPPEPGTRRRPSPPAR